MTLIQLITFAWIATWVLAESLFPTLSYAEKIQAAAFSVFVVSYANNAHGIMWQKLKKMMGV
ncbi:MAG: hypothetical protein HYX61_03460 [Gammaproteobacteria bacterium]|jgi:hypothetical protein|nr:hypothetical protein [Gammaproteobacteria bacterium]